MSYVNTSIFVMTRLIFICMYGEFKILPGVVQIKVPVVNAITFVQFVGSYFPILI